MPYIYAKYIYKSKIKAPCLYIYENIYINPKYLKPLFSFFFWSKIGKIHLLLARTVSIFLVSFLRSRFVKVQYEVTKVHVSLVGLM